MLGDALYPAIMPYEKGVMRRMDMSVRHGAKSHPRDGAIVWQRPHAGRQLV